MTAPSVLGDEAFFVGKCLSCRFCSTSENARTKLFFCLRNNPAEPTRPQWQCSFYEYEPGSLG